MQKNVLMTAGCIAVLSACGGGSTGMVPPSGAGTAPSAVKTATTSVTVTTITAPAGAYGSAVLAVSGSGTLYFGGENNYIPGFCLYTGTTCSGASDGLYSYSGGVFTLTSPRGPYFASSTEGITCGGVPIPAAPCSLGNVSAINADQFSSVLWASDYAPDSFFIPASELQSGGSGGTATTPKASYNNAVVATKSNEVVSIVRARNGRLWLGAGGPNPGIYPGTFPSICGLPEEASPCDLFFLTNGPKHDVWAMTRTYAPDAGSTTGALPTGTAFFEYGPAGSLKKTYQISEVAVAIAGTANEVWFTDFVNDAIGKIDAKGKVTETKVPTKNAGPYGIAVAANGTVWFTEFNADKVVHIDKHGHFHEFAVTFAPFSIVTTPPGCTKPAVWVGSLGNQLAEITGSKG